MARKTLKSSIGKNIVASRNRPTSMDELIETSPKSGNNKPKTQNHKITKTRNTENSKQQKLLRYEVRLDAELDLRFRRFMFDNKAKTNPTIMAALDEFLTMNGY